MKKILSVFIVSCFLFILPVSVFAQSQDNLLVQGLEAYRVGDWTSALFFLRKATSMPENLNPETWYVLIMSEMFAEDYDSVLSDGDIFISNFSTNYYIPQIQYQIARANFLKGNYTEAVRLFTNFCNSYPDHDLVPSSLFWMAESLYQTFNFDQAESLFQRIVLEYPESSKVVESAFRLELLNQREREEKLLYLLRVTGEEYLATKEDYERQLKQLQTEEVLALRAQVKQLSVQIEEMQAEIVETRQLKADKEYLLDLNGQMKTAVSEALAAVEKAEERQAAVASGALLPYGYSSATPKNPFFPDTSTTTQVVQGLTPAFQSSLSSAVSGNGESTASVEEETPVREEIAAEPSHEIVDEEILLNIKILQEKARQLRLLMEQ